jgi:hypothetical protein
MFQNTVNGKSQFSNGTVYGGLIFASMILLWFSSAGYSSGPAGCALEFDGADDYLYCQDSPSLDITNHITIEAWVNGQFADGVIHTIARKGDVYYLAISDHKLYGRIRTGDWKIVSGLPVLKDAQWYHVAMAYDKNEGTGKADLDSYDGLKADKNNPVIPEGTSGEWDQHMREIGNVIYDPDGGTKKYRTFYSGYQGAYIQEQVYIGYAYSEDGIAWTKVGKVISRPLEDPYVIKVNDTYYLYAEDKENEFPRNIRRYHSSDCETWFDDGDVFDVQTGGEPAGWESLDVSSPVVWKEADTWYMLYEGRGGGYLGKVGLATSPDGLNWTRDGNNPVFDTGESGQWDDEAVVSDDIIKIDDTYYFFYHGYSKSCGFRTGTATSADLHNWIRYNYNPVNTSADTTMIFYDNEYVFHYKTTGGIGRFYPCLLSAPRLYVNGREATYYIRQDCDNKPISADNKPLTVGKAPSGTPYLFKGTIDEVRIFDRSLSRCEIRRRMYENLNGDEPNLVGYWSFDEGSGQSVYDLSVYANHAYRGSDPYQVDPCDPNWVDSTIGWEHKSIYDLDDNGIVDFIDLSAFCQTWLAEQDVLGDFNCDRIENFKDFAELSNEIQRLKQ